MSRLQFPYQPPGSENPNLVPLPPQVDINSSRGRFQTASLGSYSAEEQTRVPDTVYQKIVQTPTGTEITETKTTTTTTQ